MQRIEARTGQDIKTHIVFKQSYCLSDFQNDYNAFRGNAYGLANTWRQTAWNKPRMHSNKVDNLYFAGQLTVPGPGIPPAFISGQIAGDLMAKHLSV